MTEIDERAVMSEAKMTSRLAEAIGRVTRSAHFCVAGDLPAVDPGLVVDGMGAISFPLKQKTAKELVTRCHVAPFGQG